MKLISWNVNGIRACIQKDCLKFVDKEDPDVFCIQETKAHLKQVDKMLDQYEYHFWNSAERPGYSGTAVFSKIKPQTVTLGINKELHDKEGRVITCEFEKFYLVNVYVPNSGRGLTRLSYRQEWDQEFRNYIQKLKQKKPVIICGDFNVAHTEIDLANPKSNYNKTAGYTQEEIDGFDLLLKTELVDTFRIFHKEGGHYTFWTYLFNARKKNIGWRIDCFLVSQELAKKVKDAFILPEVMGSDHAPVGINLS